MLELLLCSLLTIFPDYLFRRYGQGKRFGREITFFSVWFELRWGITACLLFSSLDQHGDLVLQDRSDPSRDKRPGVGSSR
jgi:hypothetical protein